MPGAPPAREIEYNQCQEAVKRLTDYLSHELVPAEEEVVQHHLNQCRGCFAKFHFEETLLRTIREKLHEVHSPDSLRGRILSIIDHQSEPEVLESS